MSRLSIGLVLAAGSVVTMTAQQRPAAASSDPPNAITVKGCVAESMGHYMLSKTVVVAPTPTPVVSAASDPAPAKTSEDQIYELLGDQVKSHLGHQVEIAGSLGVAENAAGTAQKQQQSAHPMAGTVTVKTIKMLASTCP